MDTNTELAVNVANTDENENEEDILGIIDDDNNDLGDDASLPVPAAEEEEDDDIFSVSTTEEVVATPSKITHDDRVGMIYTRRYLDQLNERVQECDYLLQKTREELSMCREKLQSLETERNEVFEEIQNSEVDGNVAAVCRLSNQHERLVKEIEAELELEGKIKYQVELAEYNLAKSQVNQGRYQLEEDDLQNREIQYLEQRNEVAQNRLKKEKKYSKNSQKIYKKKESEIEAQHENMSLRHNHFKEEAKKSQDRANVFLKNSMAKRNQKERKQDETDSAHRDHRIDALLSLKSNISANRENLRAIHARDKAYARQKQDEEDDQRASIINDGGNPDEIMMKQKRIQDFEKQKQLFKAKQRENQIEIAGRILKEEQQMQKRKKQQPCLWIDPKNDPSKVIPRRKKKDLKIFKDQINRQSDALKSSLPDFSDKRFAESEDEDEPILARSSGAISKQDLPDSDSESESAVNLAEPEFEGLWDQHKHYNVPKDVVAVHTIPGGSKMEQGILQAGLEKQRAGIIQKQVAAGREFKGVAFYSKPSVIHFKDFDVGKSYKKRVTLTNVSYSVNYCKLIGITEHLKDFIKIHFDPPGQMSAGLTCEMLVTFKPMINEDLFGEVSFMAQTGPFSIPLQCTTKKCDLSVDIKTVDFGTTVIGETLKRCFTLTNNGALGTRYDFFKVSALKPRTVTSATTSLGRETMTDIDRPLSAESDELTEKKDQPGTKRSDETGGALEISETGVEDVATDRSIDGKEFGGGEEEREEQKEAEEEQTMRDMSPPLLEHEMSEIEDFSTLDGMQIGCVSNGEIGPFSSVRLEIIWQPTIPGRVDVDFILSFSDPPSDNINVNAIANAIDVPVWVERQNVDLKICMYDRLYQDTIIVNNRATTALRLKFEVCKELKNHIELLPKTGYIQAQSQFSAQLKFLPRQTLPAEALKYFDSETGVLEAPMIIRVADQTQPVPFVVHAVVTPSDMEFDQTKIDFGHCTIHESTKTTVQLTNKSILPQKFGFVGLPDYVDVQPNDGFGTLLPLETIELDIIFSPKKARNFSFELTCKSLINRQFKIQCKGVGVHPPLELSHQIVHFAATSLNDVSTKSIHVINNHTDMNEFTHPVPRIGKGEIAPVGPTSFEFVVPAGAPLIVSPSVGTVEPNQKIRVQVRFAPTLGERTICEEAALVMFKALEAQALKEYHLAVQRENEKQEEATKKAAGGGKRGSSAKGKSSKTQTQKDAPSDLLVSGPEPVEMPKPDEINSDSDEYSQAHGALLRTYKGDFNTYVIPCYVGSGKCGKPGELPYSVHNTLYLVVHCPVIKPELVVISDSGRTTTHFGEVSKGQNVIKSISIQNISDKTLDLTSSILNTNGPFLLLNALRSLPPDGTHTLLISFTPTKNNIYYEVLKVSTPYSTLHITLTGKGVAPKVKLTVEGVVDLGAVLVGEYVERPFKIENISTLAVEFAIKLDSNSLKRYQDSQVIPAFIKQPDPAKQTVVGTQNYSGKSVFDCVPSEGIISAGESREIMITFAPDHSSEFYSDGMVVSLFGQDAGHYIQLIGTAQEHIMFMGGGDELKTDVESLSVLPVTDIEEDEKTYAKSFLVTCKSVMKDDEYIPGEGEVFVGCVRTMAVSQKKDKKKVINVF
ncbi:cilia- and flagella-associated protein 74-like isoform X2 [Tubulanus polymorphus]|uniref:cilia- and flagella-associated protein 74-like isoform X2 n=1 Tax=Tubulanus polymorphus TaxID=672921 RepID=UPI003DA20411